MEKKKSNFLHYVIAVAPIILALWNFGTTFAARNEINPFTPVGWIKEQTAISSILFTAGVNLLFITRRRFGKEDYTASIITAELGLAAICITIFMRYFWMSLSFLALLALFDAAHNSFRLSSSRPRLDKFITSTLTCVFVAALFFVSLSLFGAGN